MTIQHDSFDMHRLRSTRERLPRAASLRTIAALVLREMSVTYGRTPGGYAWAVLEPALGVGLLVLIFSAGFRTPPLGTNFGIYYASGLLPFFTFMTISGNVQQAVNYSKQLLNYPRVTFMDALLARLVLGTLTQLAVSALIFTFLLTMYETRTVLHLDRLLNAYAMAIALGFGIGVLNCLLISRHAIWGTVWSVITRPLFFISGVIFLHESIPEPYQTWLEWNPLVHVTGESRRAFYYSYVGEYVDPVYAYGVAAICAVAGLLMLQSYYRDLLER
jgi:capsular polysaccharide transport system permease protein